MPGQTSFGNVGSYSRAIAARPGRMQRAAVVLNMNASRIRKRQAGYVPVAIAMGEAVQMAPCQMESAVKKLYPVCRYAALKGKKAYL